MHQIGFPLGLRPRPHWGSIQRSPDLLLLVVFKEPTSKGRRKEGKGKGRGGKREGSGRTTLCIPVEVNRHQAGPVSTWMGDRLRAGKPSQYVTSHLGQLSLLSLRVGKSSTGLTGWGEGGVPFVVNSWLRYCCLQLYHHKSGIIYLLLSELQHHLTPSNVSQNSLLCLAIDSPLSDSPAPLI